MPFKTAVKMAAYFVFVPPEAMMTFAKLMHFMPAFIPAKLVMPVFECVRVVNIGRAGAGVRNNAVID